MSSKLQCLIVVVVLIGLFSSGNSFKLEQRRNGRGPSELLKRLSKFRYHIPEEQIPLSATYNVVSEDDEESYQIETPDSEEVPLLSHIMSRYSYYPETATEEMERSHQPGDSGLMSDVDASKGDQPYFDRSPVPRNFRIFQNGARSSSKISPLIPRYRGRTVALNIRPPMVINSQH